MSISLDHTHIVARNRESLANWYIEKLKFSTIADLKEEGEKDGPIFISGDGGRSGLAIFQARDPSKSSNPNFPALRVSIDIFIDYFKMLSNERTAEVIFDHFISLSFYIKDNEDNQVEIVVPKTEKNKQICIKNKIEIVCQNPIHYKKDK